MMALIRVNWGLKPINVFYFSIATNDNRTWWKQSLFGRFNIACRTINYLPIIQLQVQWNLAFNNGDITSLKSVYVSYSGLVTIWNISVD